jgi:hypothetical protein
VDSVTAPAFELDVMVDHPDASALLVAELDLLVRRLTDRGVILAGTLFPVETDGRTGDALWETGP